MSPRASSSEPASPSTPPPNDPASSSTPSPTDPASLSTSSPTPSSSPSSTSESPSTTPTSIASTSATSTTPMSSNTTSSMTSSVTPTKTASVTTATKATSAAAVTNSSHVSDGVIAGCVIGGTIFLALLIIGTILFCRFRRRKHIAPSSEFAETIKRGEMPVLRLDSGMEFIPPTPHHVPLPLRQNTYRTSPSIPDMKFPVGMMWSDAQSARYSLQKPLQPLRYPVHKDSDDSMMHPAHVGSSIDDSQEYWSGEPGNIETRREFVSQSPDPSYSPLMQNTYPMEQSHAVETVQNAYVDLWKLSVAPGAKSRPSSGRYNGDGQALPPLLPVRRSVDVHTLPPLVPVRRSVDIGQR